MTKPLGFAGIQMKVHPGEDNIERMAEHLETIRRDHPLVELVLFSELCAFGPEKRYAQTIPGPCTEAFRRLAREHEIWLIPGSIHETTDQGVFNSSPVFNPEGEMVTLYRKMYPWRPLETTLSGGEFCVFDIPGRLRVGLCICYDQWFPEVARQLVWQGAQVILNPLRTVTPDRRLELVLSRANAIFNQVYFLSINGLEVGGNGRSILVDPEGKVLAEAGTEEAVLTADLDPGMVDRVRREGTLGQCQVLKSFRDGGFEFPVYSQGPAAGRGFQSLGHIVNHPDKERKP